jgi:hypothetical protein
VGEQDFRIRLELLPLSPSKGVEVSEIELHQDFFAATQTST